MSQIKVYQGNLNTLPFNQCILIKIISIYISSLTSSRKNNPQKLILLTYFVVGEYENLKQIIMLKAYVLLWFIAALQAFKIEPTNCIADAACSCKFERTELMIETLLDFNSNPETKAILNHIFSVKQPYDLLNVSNKSLSFRVDCFNKSLKRIPAFKRLGYSRQPTVDCLDLRNNYIDEINESIFYGLLVRCVDLSGNRIELAHMNSLNGLLNLLTVLKLSHNQLKTANTFYGLFLTKLTKLQVLLLASNQISFVSKDTLKGLFTPILKILDLNNNVISFIADDAFNDFDSLSYLNLCNNKLGNEIAMLNSSKNALTLGFLAGLKQLETLQLCGNSLRHISGSLDNFKHNKQLKMLNLDLNKLKTLNDMFCLNSASNYLDNMNELHVAWNSISEIFSMDLSCLRGLEKLYLQYNNINSIHLAAFKHLNKLKLLQINNNPLMPYPNMFNGLQYSLESLIINFNVAECKSKIEFEKAIEIFMLQTQLKQLRTLDLSDSVFETLSINVADLLLTESSLRTVVCLNCNMKRMGLKYHVSNKDSFKYTLYSSNKSEQLEFVDKYRTHICPRKTQQLIEFDFKYNQILDCDQITWATHNKTEDTRFYYIKTLSKFITIKNFECKAVSKRGSQLLNWHGFYSKYLAEESGNSYLRRLICSANKTNKRFQLLTDIFAHNLARHDEYESPNCVRCLFAALLAVFIFY